MPPLAQHSGSLADMLDCMRSFLAAHPRADGAWLVGRGWNQDYFTDEVRMPTRHDLDTISTEVPIIYTRACGHICAANSKALELAGITRDTQPVAGGEIYRDENGEPILAGGTSSISYGDWE